MPDPTQPKAWANLLTRLWGPRFPVDVRMIAMDYTRQRFSDSIAKIVPAEVDYFEGALMPLRKSGRWAILYNPGIISPGRINFTLAHELGHYLVHRALSAEGFECGQKEVLGVDRAASDRKIEEEADAFASYLLMPLDDYRTQIGQDEMTLDLLRHCADRYGVSMTAAAIKWLDCTPRCAVLVVATNGFVLWCWRSAAARRQRIYFETGMALPAVSLAAQPGLTLPNADYGIRLNRKVWGASSDAREMAIFADQYEMTISLLVFDDMDGRYDEEEPVEQDTVDFFNRLSRR
ncbi:MAG: ImmA/IrrE family metallo-endopeptidase [Roseomonas mucosa]|nr:ImmA/IrrE family metallo-endopeptidase [Roseomonas mucosa]